MRRNAFTLLEIVLVMAVIVVVGAVTLPSLKVMYDQHKVTASCDAVKGAMVQARGQAIEQGVPYRFAYLPGKGNYRVAPNMESYWQNVSSTDGGLIIEGQLEGGIVFPMGEQVTLAEDGVNSALDVDQVPLNQWKGIAVFLPDGTARPYEDTAFDLISIPLATQTSATMVIRLRCLTGSVTTGRMTQGSN